MFKEKKIVFSNTCKPALKVFFLIFRSISWWISFTVYFIKFISITVVILWQFHKYSFLLLLRLKRLVSVSELLLRNVDLFLLKSIEWGKIEGKIMGEAIFLLFLSTKTRKNLEKIHFSFFLMFLFFLIDKC